MTPAEQVIVDTFEMQQAQIVALLGVLERQSRAIDMLTSVVEQHHASITILSRAAIGESVPVGGVH
jgi:hypothetical protein